MFSLSITRSRAIVPKVVQCFPHFVGIKPKSQENSPLPAMQVAWMRSNRQVRKHQNYKLRLAKANNPVKRVCEMPQSHFKIYTSLLKKLFLSNLSERKKKLQQFLQFFFVFVFVLFCSGCKSFLILFQQEALKYPLKDLPPSTNAFGWRPPLGEIDHLPFRVRFTLIVKALQVFDFYHPFLFSLPIIVGLFILQIQRTKSKMLPVYTDYKNGGTRVLTLIRKVEGDVLVSRSCIKLISMIKRPVSIGSKRRIGKAASWCSSRNKNCSYSSERKQKEGN